MACRAWTASFAPRILSASYASSSRRPSLTRGSLATAHLLTLTAGCTAQRSARHSPARRAWKILREAACRLLSYHGRPRRQISRWYRLACRARPRRRTLRWYRLAYRARPQRPPSASRRPCRLWVARALFCARARSRPLSQLRQRLPVEGFASYQPRGRTHRRKSLRQLPCNAKALSLCQGRLGVNDRTPLPVGLQPNRPTCLRFRHCQARPPIFPRPTLPPAAHSSRPQRCLAVRR